MASHARQLLSWIRVNNHTLDPIGEKRREEGRGEEGNVDDILIASLALSVTRTLARKGKYMVEMQRRNGN